MSRATTIRYGTLATIAAGGLLLAAMDWTAATSGLLPKASSEAARQPVSEQTQVLSSLGENSQPVGQLAAPNCQPNAPGTPPNDHGKPAEFGPSQAFPAGQPPTTSQISDFARRMAGMFGGTRPASPSTPLFAREMSFADFRALAGWPDNPSINPQRCVWVLTVHAPMAVKVSPGESPSTVDVYSVAVDGASGTTIGVLAGTDLIH